MIEVMPRVDEKLVQALEDPRYQWRTVDGLAVDLGLSREEVAEKLAAMRSRIVRSSIPDELGQALYTTRDHYKTTHSVGERLLAAVAGRVA